MGNETLEKKINEFENNNQVQPVEPVQQVQQVQQVQPVQQVQQEQQAQQVQPVQQAQQKRAPQLPVFETLTEQAQYMDAKKAEWEDAEKLAQDEYWAALSAIGRAFEYNPNDLLPAARQKRIDDSKEFVRAKEAHLRAAELKDEWGKIFTHYTFVMQSPSERRAPLHPYDKLRKMDNEQEISIGGFQEYLKTNYVKNGGSKSFCAVMDALEEYQDCLSAPMELLLKTQVQRDKHAKLYAAVRKYLSTHTSAIRSWGEERIEMMKKLEEALQGTMQGVEEVPEEFGKLSEKTRQRLNAQMDDYREFKKKRALTKKLEEREAEGAGSKELDEIKKQARPVYQIKLLQERLEKSYLEKGGSASYTKVKETLDEYLTHYDDPVDETDLEQVTVRRTRSKALADAVEQYIGSHARPIRQEYGRERILLMNELKKTLYPLHFQSEMVYHRLYEQSQPDFLASEEVCKETMRTGTLREKLSVLLQYTKQQMVAGMYVTPEGDVWDMKNGSTNYFKEFTNALDADPKTMSADMREQIKDLEDALFYLNYAQIEQLVNLKERLLKRAPEGEKPDVFSDAIASHSEEALDFLVPQYTGQTFLVGLDMYDRVTERIKEMSFADWKYVRNSKIVQDMLANGTLDKIPENLRDFLQNGIIADWQSQLKPFLVEKRKVVPAPDKAKS